MHQIRGSPASDKPNVVENLLIDHVELPHVLDLAVHLVNQFGWLDGH